MQNAKCKMQKVKLLHQRLGVFCVLHFEFCILNYAVLFS
jgi:hypothetical protein